MKHRINALFILAFLFCLFGSSSKAETPRSILDRTAAALTKGGIKTSFVATTFKDNSPQGSTSGTIQVSDNRFYVQTPHTSIWFNGTTQWSLMNGASEVYVSTPTAAELQSINPYTFINLYKKGYKLRHTETTYKQRAAYEVTLTATSKAQNISQMLVTIDKATNLPTCIRLKSTKTGWVRIQISDTSTGLNLPNSTFEFSDKAHPGVQIVDLR